MLGHLDPWETKKRVHEGNMHTSTPLLWRCMLRNGHVACMYVRAQYPPGTSGTAVINRYERKSERQRERERERERDGADPRWREQHTFGTRACGYAVCGTLRAGKEVTMPHLNDVWSLVTCRCVAAAPQVPRDGRGRAAADALDGGRHRGGLAGVLGVEPR